LNFLSDQAHIGAYSASLQGLLQAFTKIRTSSQELVSGHCTATRLSPTAQLEAGFPFDQHRQTKGNGLRRKGSWGLSDHDHIIPGTSHTKADSPVAAATAHQSVAQVLWLMNLWRLG
jgi:hypothetical protein